MCEPASHASHNASHASHASQGVSHASHASQGASHASHNMENEKLKKKKLRDLCGVTKSIRYGCYLNLDYANGTSTVLPFCSQHASPTVSSKLVPLSINDIQDLEN